MAGRLPSCLANATCGSQTSGCRVSSEPTQFLNEPYGTGRRGSRFRNMIRPERSTGRAASGGRRTCRNALPRPRRRGCRRQQAGASGRSPSCRHLTRPDACSTAHRPGPPGACATGSARRIRVRQQQTRMTRTARYRAAQTRAHAARRGPEPSSPRTRRPGAPRGNPDREPPGTHRRPGRTQQGRQRPD